MLYTALAREDEDDDVRYAIINELYFIGHICNTDSLLAWSAHPSPAIRLAVARALVGINTPEVIQALITLTHDPDDDVRDWAVSSLADTEDEHGHYLATDDIIEALADCLDDSFDFVRGGALEGLARRGDSRVIIPLLREFALEDHPPMVDYALVAAGLCSGDPRLLPALLAWRENQETFYDEAKEIDKYYEDERVKRENG